jgi:hypothetical protein
VRRSAPLLLASLLAAPAAAQVSVRLVPAAAGGSQQVELTARAAPLAEVLDRLAKQLGMKVVYEGAHPRQPVTLSLQGRSPVETVLGVLEGQGLNYAILSDTTGTRVETLLVAGSAPQTASSASAPAGRPTAPSAFRRPIAPPPGSGPDTMDEPEDLEEDEGLGDPAADAAEAADGGAGPADPNAANPAAPQAPGFAPTAPAPSFPVSPFAPQATPYTPQPFPPVPPGAPVAQPQQPEQATSPPPQG